ncbi:hypothetical protein [Xanthomonas vesicatoria]|uniref:hypothetical protein n=1 Tax=Xanthomonas vesicatoria TaxID=56460 RepID=UPI0011120096|nr:hypothetical protein [Xanthomonas vesicatoria]
MRMIGGSQISRRSGIGLMPATIQVTRCKRDSGYTELPTRDSDVFRVRSVECLPPLTNAGGHACCTSMSISPTSKTAP